MSYDKYIKYKTKYLQLKAKHVQQGGAGKWIIEVGTTPITLAESRLLEERKSNGIPGKPVIIGYSYVINPNGITGIRTSLKGGVKINYPMKRLEGLWTITPGTTPITPIESEFLDGQIIHGKTVKIGYSYVINSDGLTGTRTSMKDGIQASYKMTYVQDAQPSSLTLPPLSSFAQSPPGGRSSAPHAPHREGSEFKPSQSPPSFRAPPSPSLSPSHKDTINKYIGMISFNKAIKLSPVQIEEFRKARLDEEKTSTLSKPVSPEYLTNLNLVFECAEGVSLGLLINQNVYESSLGVVKKYLGL